MLGNPPFDSASALVAGWPAGEISDRMEKTFGKEEADLASRVVEKKFTALGG